jgi:hypothetical protein
LKINFTKKEFGLLLQMVDTATWVMNAHRTEVDSRVDPFLAMEQKIFAVSQEFGCEDKIDPPNGSLEIYTVTDEFAFQSPHRELIEEYDEDTFYTMLVDRLTYVSIVREMGLEKYQAMSHQEKSPLIDKYESFWHEQLGELGVDDLLKKTVDLLLSNHANAQKPVGGKS